MIWDNPKAFPLTTAVQRHCSKVRKVEATEVAECSLLISLVVKEIIYWVVTWLFAFMQLLPLLIQVEFLDSSNGCRSRFVILYQGLHSVRPTCTTHELLRRERFLFNPVVLTHFLSWIRIRHFYSEYGFHSSLFFCAFWSVLLESVTREWRTVVVHLCTIDFWWGRTTLCGSCRSICVAHSQWLFFVYVCENLMNGVHIFFWRLISLWMVNSFRGIRILVCFQYEAVRPRDLNWPVSSSVLLLTRILRWISETRKELDFVRVYLQIDSLNLKCSTVECRLKASEIFTSLFVVDVHPSILIENATHCPVYRTSGNATLVNLWIEWQRWRLFDVSADTRLFLSNTC